MIRINLLKHLPAPTERLQAMLNPGRTGGFISRRETVLGGLFLALAFTILGTQLWLSQESAEPEPIQPVAAQPAPRTPRATPPTPAAPQGEANEVAEAFAKLPPAEDPPPAPDPEPPAAKKAAPPDPPLEGGGKLTGVSVTPLEDGVDVFLPIKGRPRVRTFRVDNPNRVVFDIPGAILDAPNEQRVQRVESPWVTRVRVAQNDLDPPLVRIVLEVPEFPAVDNSVSDAGVAIRVRQP